MSDYRKIAEEALKRAKKVNLSKKHLNENVVYPEGISERMHPKLEDELANGTHSLKGSPIFPEGDEHTFEQKIIGERFSDVTKRYKRAYDVDSINNQDVMKNMMPLVYETMGLEAKHKKSLENLAIKMIREEYDMDDDIVEIHAELTSHINMVGTKKNPKPISVAMDLKNHDELVNANKEVYKRRFLNAMTQGASMKVNHMFHMVDDELTDLDPRLANKYSKVMAAADYMFYVVPEMEEGVNGGVVRVQFPTKNNPKAIIHVQAMIFPVLIHELVKGVMELISAHGLPKNKKIGEYVINKADFLSAEPWDMRIGPAIWERFTKMIEPDDFHLKHHILCDLASLPVNEFNVKMREIIGGTKEGKKVIKDLVDNIKNELQNDDFDSAMNEIGWSSNLKNEKNSDDLKSSESFDYKDLFGDDTSPNSDDNPNGWDFEELF